MRRVAVVGGGIAGLATCLHLRDAAASIPGGLDVALFEAGPRPGGHIGTEAVDGFLVERGPNGYLDNVPAMARLVRRLGLEADIVRAEGHAAKRYLYRRGTLHLLPAGPGSFLVSPLLSLPGRLRVLLEPFARGAPEGVDETVHAFAGRRIGREAAEVLVDAMVSGVFAGDARKLSLASAFPKMAAMEEEHGSLTRAMIARLRDRRSAARHARRSGDGGAAADPPTRAGGPAGPGGTLTSFRGGLASLIDGLADTLGSTVRTSERVLAVERPHPGPLSAGPAWRIVREPGERIEADAVVLATPAPAAASLVQALDPSLATDLAGIASAGVAVVAVGFHAAAMGGPPEGFGFLSPRMEGLRSLGCLWDSSLFPGRAPDGEVLLRVMIGGAHDPEALELDDDDLVAVARRDLAAAMGLTAAPHLLRVFRHPAGIPQYERGHRARLDRIEERLRGLPGMWLTGCSYRGVSMNACVETAERQCDEIVRFLARLESDPWPASSSAASTSCSA